MKIFNSLGRKKNEFIPLVKDTVSLYVCGMTVYDYCHLGHARVVIFFDIVRRWFEACNYKVVYVRNITDIDDKIIARAKEKKISIKNLTDKYVDEMQKDFKRHPRGMVRATLRLADPPGSKLRQRGRLLR